MSVDPEYQVVSAYFKSLNIHFNEKWVYENINNVKSANFGISVNDLKKLVYEKWLSTNLRDLKVGSLPPNVSSFSKITLSGTYAVQVESMKNSAKSCYSELQRIENPANCDDSEKQDDDVNSKRCLTFVLCDGVQEVQGMEYHTISSIRLNDSDFPPGFKMIIKGPVVCRKGMLLLKQENVKVYGGKVESLCETNNLMRELQRTLGIGENNINPVSAVKISNNHTTSPNGQPRESTQPVETYNISDEAMEMDELLSQNDDILLGLTFESGFEDYFIEDDSRQDAENENFFSVPKKPRINSYHETVMQEGSNNQILDKNSSSNGRNSRMVETWGSCYNKKAETEMLICASTSTGHHITPAIPNTLDDDIEFASQYLKNKPTYQNATQNTQVKMSLDPTSIKEPALEIVPQNINSNHMEEQMLKTVSSYPFVYLKQVESIVLTQSKVFTVKAIILTLKSKINIKNDEFSLKAVISDGSSSILVDMSSDIVEKIMEYSPCEVKSMMIDKTRNSAVAGRLKEIFSSAQQKLLSMNCLMDIKFFSHVTPLIVGLEEVQLEHVNALKARS